MNTYIYMSSWYLNDSPSWWWDMCWWRCRALQRYYINIYILYACIFVYIYMSLWGLNDSSSWWWDLSWCRCRVFILCVQSICVLQCVAACCSVLHGVNMSVVYVGGQFDVDVDAEYSCVKLVARLYMSLLVQVYVSFRTCIYLIYIRVCMCYAGRQTAYVSFGIYKCLFWYKYMSLLVYVYVSFTYEYSCVKPVARLYMSLLVYVYVSFGIYVCLFWYKYTSLLVYV